MPSTHPTQHNHLLAAMQSEVWDRVAPYLELVPLSLGKVLHDQTDGRYVYFPTDAIVSMFHVLESGATVETSLVGNEGMVGVASFMGGESAGVRATVQRAGYAYRMPRQRLNDEFNRQGELLQLLLLYTQCQITHVAQTAVCNRFHSTEQRLCRWLLHYLDRSPGKQLSATQEMVANGLGVRREGVTESANRLRKLGAIDYFRGWIEVLDRSALEKSSCECYAVIRKETDRLLPH